MGHLSKHLRSALKHPHLTANTVLNVAVRLVDPIESSMNRIPRTEKARRKAFDLLHAAGLRGGFHRSAGVHPICLLRGSKTVTFQVEARHLERLSKAGGVKYVRPSRMHRPHLNQSVLIVGVDSGVRSKYNGNGIRVAIIDTGVDFNHSDLKSVKTNPDISKNFTSIGAVSDVTDSDGHGTHVAGIIAGNGAKYKGVAPGIELFCCKVWRSSDDETDDVTIASAVRYAVQQGAKVINYSGGYSPVRNNLPVVTPPWLWPSSLTGEEEELKTAMDKGVVVVVSAGNNGTFGKDGTISVPATCSELISVGAVNRDLQVPKFSSWGPVYRSAQAQQHSIPVRLTEALRKNAAITKEVDLVAPGGDRSAQSECVHVAGIVSTLSSKATPFSCRVETRYVLNSGTSQSAPHVSGLAALLLQAAEEIGVDLGPPKQKAYAVKAILMKAAEPIPGYPSSQQGSGIPKWSNIEKILRDLKNGAVNISSLLEE